MKQKVVTTVAGIEFDALIEAQETHSATVPQYPLDEGYSVSDNVALDPTALKLTLYVTATPVTWLSRHGVGDQRIENICNQLLDLYKARSPVSVTTPRKSYDNMIIKNITISDTTQAGYAKEIPIEFTEITVTAAKSVVIPAEYARGGNTMESNGAASTTKAQSSTPTTASDRQSGKASGDTTSSSKNGSTLLYNMASGLGNKTGWYSLE